MDLRGKASRFKHAPAGPVGDVDQVGKAAALLQNAIGHDDLSCLVHMVLVRVEDAARTQQRCTIDTQNNFGTNVRLERSHHVVKARLLIMRALVTGASYVALNNILSVSENRVL